MPRMRSLKKEEKIKIWTSVDKLRLYMEMEKTEQLLARMIAISKLRIQDRKLRQRTALMRKKKKMNKSKNVELEMSLQWQVVACVEEPIKREMPTTTTPCSSARPPRTRRYSTDLSQDLQLSSSSDEDEDDGIADD
ncbi:unnamed protein product [Orchesella dallaii]|uniref:Uncharacterized protein n=1 Tax=Orchesella dallaii TaxID=48710 RepID=A0ABP1R4X8_9HEXA